MLLKGLKIQEAPSPNQRLPITSDLLIRCICTIRSGYTSPLISLTLESMFLLAYFGFLRCSEFAPTTSRFDPSIHPRLSDISVLNQDTLIFTLRKSKTDQLGISFPICLFRLHSPISPYEPISNYISFRLANNGTPHDPLFITELGSITTRFWFSHHFHQILFRSGINPEHYSIHSICIGAATSASQSGIFDKIIQILGRWSSSAYHTYIHNNLDDLPHAHSLLC